MRTELSRQVVHLSGLLFVILAQFVDREVTIITFLTFTVFFFLYSWHVRSQGKKLSRFIHRMESRFRDFALGFEREDVRNPFTGAMLFYAGCTLSFLLFPLPVASAACAMLAVGDSLSTIVGIKFGRHKIGRKSLEGSLACFIFSFAAGSFFVNPFLALAGAVAASLIELFPRIDDNLTIPIISGLVMFLLTIV